MRNKALILIYLLLLGIANLKAQIDLEPENVTALPESGFAGMYGGEDNGVLIAAGGANFPDALPWKGGKKVWQSAVYVLKANRWQQIRSRLPEPLAYGASVRISEGILCIGGENADATSKRVFLMQFESEYDSLIITDYPDLPEPLAYTAATQDGDYVYVVGGKDKIQTSNRFYRLSLSNLIWERLPDFPGPPRALHALAVQDTRDSRALFVIGGRAEQAGKKSLPHSDFLAFDFKTQIWTEMGPINPEGTPVVLMGASATAEGAMHLLVFGGSDEVLFDTLEKIALELQQNPSDAEREALIARRDAILNNHPGFSKSILAYNTLTNTWFTYANCPDPLPVTTLSFKYESDFYLASGEIAPGIRTPKVLRFTELNTAEPFGFLNFMVLGGYLLLSVLIGLYFSRKQKSTDDYFTGGGRIPWWAAGLSLFGTLLSAITFMAIPAKAFATDWSFFMLNMMAICITPVIAFVFIPFFNRLKIQTAYEFLEVRFNYTARAFGSLSFILFQLGRIGIVLLLPALAISMVTGIPVDNSIIIMGVLCIVYTTFGGIEAVIWTDVMQVIVLLGGSVLAVVWLFLDSSSSPAAIFELAQERNKFNIADLSLDFTKSTFWVVVFGGLASAMVTQGTDQTIVQRYLTARNLRDSRKTLYTNAVLTLPATLIFFGIGTLLFNFYVHRPERLTPDLANIDAIFPWFIVTELPVGVSGLLIAGIFSAAMSSISSSLNSVSTAFCNDFYKRFVPGAPDTKLLKIARVATLITGLFGVLLALWMAHSNIKSLWDEFYRYLGLFTGGLGGMFLLGMLTKRANGIGTLVGLGLSAIITAVISAYTPISFLMFAFFGVVSCFGLGYIFSLIFTKKEAL